jgi:hypothetical protein
MLLAKSGKCEGSADGISILVPLSAQGPHNRLGIFLEDAEQGLGRTSWSPPALLPVLDGVPPENVLLVRAASPVFNRRNRRNLWQNPSSLPSREGRSDRGMEDSKEKTFSAADYADFADWGKGGNTDEPGPAFGRNQEKPRAFIALRGTSGERGHSGNSLASPPARYHASNALCCPITKLRQQTSWERPPLLSGNRFQLLRVSSTEGTEAGIRDTNNEIQDTTLSSADERR